MIVIPAIDIKNGQCVRLLQGRMDTETVFSTSPAAAAQRWQSEGAEMIHVVDLDGAVAKKPCNADVISDILKAVRVPIQVGGGIRDTQTIDRYLSRGVRRIVIGTEAIRNPDWVKDVCKRFAGAVVVAIDAREGLVAIEGWTQTTAVSAVELAREFEDCGVAAINFTDIHRDGMQTGPNIPETRRLAEAVTIPVVASGGVSSLQDIQNLLPLRSCGLAGVITGRALYTGTLDLKEAIALSKSN